MADEADMADVTQQQELELLLRQKRPTLKVHGFCHNCDEPTAGLFCNVECRDDHELREKLRASR